jgi:hypothetical protein
MNRAQLEHAIRAACNISDDKELIVFGSQAILAGFPEPHPELRKSIEVDVFPKNKPNMVDRIDGALGENSMFHKTHGFYVHGVSIESASLPAGWLKRTIKVQDYMDTTNVGYCIEVHDLAVSKLIAFRDKDTEFVRRLIIEEMIDTEVLMERLRETDADNALIVRAIRWVKRITES